MFHRELTVRGFSFFTGTKIHALQIVVSSAPDLRSSRERENIRQMVSTFANAPHAIGDQSVQFWMFEMERYYHTEMNATMKDEASVCVFCGLSRWASYR